LIKKAGKHKIKFHDYSNVKIVENWKEYNIIRLNISISSSEEEEEEDEEKEKGEEKEEK